MPDNRMPVIRVKESDDIKKAWGEEDDNEAYDRTVAYVKNLISHMD